MSEFLREFFQSRQDIKLHKRLQFFSCSLRRILADIRDIKEVEMRYFYGVSLDLITFAAFDSSKLVRFELTDCTNSLVNCYSEGIQYDRPHDTFFQQFEIKKESEDELQIEAIAFVHLDGQIRRVGAFESVIEVPSSKYEVLAKCPLPVAVKTELTGSGNHLVVLSSTRRKTMSEALCVLQNELGDDVVDGAQVKITESHLMMCCFPATVGVVRLRLLYKWRSEAISVDSKDFVAIGEPSATNASTSASDSGTTASSPLEAELAALSIASRPGDRNGNFVMDPSAVEMLQRHAHHQYGHVEIHLHQTIQKGHVCVTGKNTSLHMEMPETAQRFLQEGLCAPSQKSITAGPSSNEGEVSEPQKNQSIDMEETED
ncbi:uncharacterized protein LOC110066679 [Orbicella faveolata]|uniref:uncharacterized protein LOC110066679 n=1 Tax=Orbicella faveolata TaxID=48498 RepID=UPI0009E43ACE|nr:uncharacterized protein LOC110066679 [Orbicella faveolata]